MNMWLKRALMLILCLCMVAGVWAVPLGSFAAEAVEVNVQNGTGTRTPMRVGGSYAYRAIVNGSFDGFGFNMPTWKSSTSSATLSLYKWAGTYQATVAGAPIATRVFDPLLDGEYHWVEFEAQPAGEYLFHVSQPKGDVGVWTNTSPTDSKGFMYENGIEGRGEADLLVRLTEAVEEPFGSCEASGDVRVTQLVAKGGSGEAVVNIGAPMGYRLTTAAPIVGVEFKMATYFHTDYTIKLSVYEWQGSYQMTIASEAKATETITMVDNAYQGITFPELPAGDYLFLVHNPSAAPAMYYFNKVTNFEGVVYQNGFPAEEPVDFYPECRLTFTKDLGADPYFLPCEAVEGEVIDGEHTAPPAYEIPEDSLIKTHPVMPDTWVFTDGLGRVSLTNAEVGDLREDKTLAMFFWTWHTNNFVLEEPHNLQELSAKYPEAMNDWNHALWQDTNGYFSWNEPIWGYYRSTDKWVARKQAELLANAGVDVIFTDNTNNAETWRESYTAIMEVWDQAMTDGVMTPKLSFMLPFGAGDNSNAQLRSIYLDLFRADKWSNLWYYLDGKPMIMAYPDALSADSSLLDKEILQYFTFRPGYAGYINPTQSIGQWGWLSTYPQKIYYATRQDYRKVPEQIAVGVAMNHNYMTGQLSAMNGPYTMGRSYTSNYEDRYEKEGAEASKWGYNFAEQFAYAIEQDPKVIFVTGWNEWRVGRHDQFCGVTNAFPDQFNDEYSRDLEPTKGALQDHYYYQLVNFSRQYQGARPIPTPSGKVTIDMGAGAEQWTAVEPYYGAYIGNVDHRDEQGYGDLRYTETSGRNDIIGAQVARDDEFVYFLVECAENITAYTDSLWMNLYIDAAGDGALDGWNSFDYVVGKTAPSATTAVLERFTGNGYASERVADVAYTVDGRYMTVKIKKADLGLSGDDYTINFSWTDNVHDEGDYTTFSGDIMDFYISGDVAPGGRFKYSYISTAENAGGAVETQPVVGEESEPVTDGATDEVTAGGETAGETETEIEASKGGCKSALGMSAAVLALLCGAALVCRRRED